VVRVTVGLALGIGYRGFRVRVEFRVRALKLGELKRHCCAGEVELETSDRVIPLRSTSAQDRIWHLVKHHPDNGTATQESAPLVIPEIFLTRLLTTKVSNSFSC